MKTLVPIVIILLATILFIVELTKESSWQVKAEMPIEQDVNLSDAIDESEIISMETNDCLR